MQAQEKKEFILLAGQRVQVVGDSAFAGNQGTIKFFRPKEAAVHFDADPQYKVKYFPIECLRIL